MEFIASLSATVGAITMAIAKKVRAFQKSVNFLSIGRRQVPVIFQIQDPRIQLVENFLTASECRQLIQAAKSTLERSTILTFDTGKSKGSKIRTSDGTYFRKKQSALIAAIEKRCQQWTGFPEINGEFIQVMRYRKGGEYRSHHDYFDPKVPSFSEQFLDGGQRIATILLYLNDVKSGGATEFTDLGVKVYPKKGSALLFMNVDQSNRVDSSTLHAGLPVETGEKWIATLWIREKAFRQKKQ